LKRLTLDDIGSHPDVA